MSLVYGMVSGTRPPSRSIALTQLVLALVNLELARRFDDELVDLSPVLPGHALVDATLFSPI